MEAQQEGPVRLRRVRGWPKTKESGITDMLCSARLDLVEGTRWQSLQSRFGDCRRRLGAGKPASFQLLQIAEDAAFESSASCS